MSENDKMKIAFSIGKNPPKLVDVFSQAMGKDKRIDFNVVMDSKQAICDILNGSHGIVMCCISSPDELKELIEFLPQIKMQMSSGFIRVLVMTSLNHPKLPVLLRSRGCSDVVDYKLSVKGLFYKTQNLIGVVLRSYSEKDKPSIGNIDFNTSIKRELKKNPAADSSLSNRDESNFEPDFSSNSIAKPNKKTVSKSISQLKKTSPIETEADCWLVADEKDIREVMGHWIVHLVGPGPSAGKWDLTDTIKTKSGQTWIWKPRHPEKDPFIKEKGSWLFSGKEPEFMWEKNVWRFVGSQPALLFYKDLHTNNYRYAKFRFEEPATLYFAENSQTALGKLDLIKNTLENSIRYKKEKRKSQDPQELPLEFEPRGFPLKEGDVTWEKDEENSVDPNVLSFNKKKKTTTTASSIIFPEEETLSRGWKTSNDLFKGIDMELVISSVDGIELDTAQTLELIEFLDEDHLTLECPQKYAQSGAEILVIAYLEEQGETHQKAFRMKITSAEQATDSSSLIYCELLTGEASKAAFILEIFERRQKEIVKFFGGATGK